MSENQLTLTAALEAVFQQPAITLPANFQQTFPTVTSVEARRYTAAAACSYYRAAQYRVANSPKHMSRVITYDQSFSFQEIS